MSETIFYKRETYKFVDVITENKIYVEYEEFHNPEYEFPIEVSISSKLKDTPVKVFFNKCFELQRREEAIILFNKIVETHKIIADENYNQQVIFEKEESTIIKKGFKNETNKK